MILTIASWGWIAAASFLCGFGILKVTADRKKQTYRAPDIYFLFGLCGLTVYSQAISLFSKVGLAATIVLVVACMLVVAIWRKELLEYAGGLITALRKPYILLPLLLIGWIVLAMTVRYTAHYDTDLYHGQSIRWIEEYGIVKGLGNLHNRFAYNSAFFCLQALFGMKFLVNQSLHTLNGFIAVIMLMYAVTTLRIFRGKKLATSDLFKLGIIYYFCFTEARYVISSPGSDILALSLVLYICARWAEYMEQDNREPLDYGLLCILAVWAVTVKLSAATLVLFAAYPAVLLIRKKSWKIICCLLGAGILIVSPFLARNVVVSGYLVYPYSSIDLFDVDWKMQASVAEDDSREIMAWGRGMTSRADYDAPMEKWLPGWYGNLDTVSCILVWLNVLCIVGACIYALWAVWKRTQWQRLTLLLVSLAGLLMWFLTSPLIRYGVVYMLLLPAIFGGLLLEKVKGKIIAYGACVAFLCISTLLTGRNILRYGIPPLKRPVDYNWRENDAVAWQGIIIYIPQGGDSGGYHDFPNTTGRERLEYIELRTGRLEDGFRLKAVYKNTKIDLTGTPSRE